MKILILNGSPKGEAGNTIKLTRAFVEGLQSKTEAEIETVGIYKLDISPCRGCFACWNKTPGICCIRDDMAELLVKIREADVVIWSFPLYYFSLPGQLKNMMDRQLPLVLPFMTEGSEGRESGAHPSRYDMHGQRTVLISTCGFHTAAGNYDAVRDQFDLACGTGKHTDIFCGQGELFRVPELSERTGEYLEIVRQAGAEFAEGGITEETAAQLARPLYSRETFEKMADASWGVDDAGEKMDEGVRLITQMSALYNPKSWKGADRVLEFYFTDTGVTCQILLGKDESRMITKDFLPYTTRIETPFPVWQRIARNEISGAEAMMKGQYRTLGDFSLMTDWGTIFGYGDDEKEVAEEKEKETGQAPKKKTNMTVLLLPWLVLWIFLPMNAAWGIWSGLIACGLMPLCWLKWRRTEFETISFYEAAAICALAALGVTKTILVPLSYLLFGILWTVTAFQKIPLTAKYSMNDYGGDHSLGNPLFIKTNRILTACWGVLYLLTPIWTYFMMISPRPGMTGLINSVLPAALGIFTVWFQKWYPAWVARRG